MGSIAVRLEVLPQSGVFWVMGTRTASDGVLWDLQVSVYRSVVNTLPLKPCSDLLRELV
jgi:hypothetical protein